jgi:hypothetical protein
MRLAYLALPFLAGWLAAAQKPSVLVVAGAPGTDAYGLLFSEWSDQWKTVAEQAEADFQQVDQPVEGHARDALEETLAAEDKNSPHPLWLVFIGHGTFDGKRAKFNLRGPDLEATELAAWLKDFARPLVIINCSSSSAPFLKGLSSEGRIVITATRSGFEQNFCHLGGFLATAIGDISADLDKDGQVSILEAWLIACKRTNTFYEEEGRLPTEHSLLDDNGDAKGTQSDWFRGLQVTKKSAEEGLLPDGLRAHQIHLIRSENERRLTAEQINKRDALELDLARLRAKKSKLEEKTYYQRLEKLLIDMGHIYFPDGSPPAPGE